MHFSIKNYLKSNHYHTAKHPHHRFNVNFVTRSRVKSVAPTTQCSFLSSPLFFLRSLISKSHPFHNTKVSCNFIFIFLLLFLILFLNQFIFQYYFLILD